MFRILINTLAFLAKAIITQLAFMATGFVTRKHFHFMNKQKGYNYASTMHF